MLDSPLLSTKLFIPPVRPEVLTRPPLLKRLDGALSPAIRLVLIAAPAGFGKTTLVSDWQVSLKARGIPMAWLTLSAGDNDPVRFLRYLIAALQKVHPEAGQMTLALLDLPQLPPLEPLLTGLINDLSSYPGNFVLALDDYHTISEVFIHRALEFLLDSGPLNLHVLILTRQDPLLPLPRLRARGQVVEIRSSDLRFSVVETASLLKDVIGINLTQAQVATLEKRTEGWIAGLQMAALSMRGREDIEGFLDAFSGSHIFVFDYLAQEILAQQSPATGEFLHQTSILERFCSPLCDATTGRQDSQAVIRQLEKSNLFITPLDEHRQWYRYHPLFADFLRSELSGPEASRLHSAAARWFEANGFLAEAIQHTLAAGEVAEATRLIIQASSGLFKNGELITLRKWLELLPAEVIRASYDLATYMGWMTMLSNQIDVARAYTDDAERAFTDQTPATNRGRLVGLRAYLTYGTGSQEEALQLATQSLELLGENEPIFRSTILTLLGQIQRQMGDALSAEKTFREAQRIGEHISHNIGVCVAEGNLAWIINVQGHLRRSIELCRQAVAQFTDRAGHVSPLALFILVPGANAYYDANDLDTAQSQLTQGFEFCQQVGVQPIIVGGQGLQAMIHLARGRYQEALETIIENRMDAETHQLTWIALVIGSDEANIRMSLGDLTFAREWVAATRHLLTPRLDPNLDFIYFTHIRLALAENRAGDVLPLLQELIESAQRGGRLRVVLTAHILQAAALQQLNRAAEAMQSIELALRFSAPEGYLRAFLDEGRSVQVLVAAYWRSLETQAGHPLRPFVEQLLGLFDSAPSFDLASPVQGSISKEVSSQTQRYPSQARPTGLIENLTPRELEVLKLMSAGLSNAEIARKLYLTVNTLKAHTNSIYGKLDVHSRMQAVIKAQDLNLL